MPQFNNPIHALGGLHDAVPCAIVWESDKRIFTIRIRDLHANFIGLPEYKGAISGIVVLDSVELVEMQLNLSQTRLKIYDWIITEFPDGEHQSVITFSPEGRIVAKHRGLNVNSTYQPADKPTTSSLGS